MSKLEFDRLISLSIQKGERVIVPKGEFWEWTWDAGSGSVYLNSSTVGYYSVRCVEGAIIRPSNLNSGASVNIQGIAFKVVENV